MGEAELIRELQQGNRQAFSMLADTYGNMVYNAVLHIVHQKEEAEDVTQEVFIQVFLSIKSFRQQAKLSTWLYQVAIRKAIDRERKNKLRQAVQGVRNVFSNTTVVESITDGFHPGIAMDQKENAEALYKALQQLPERQRIAFILARAEGLSYNEVAEILSVSAKAVDGLLTRAKEQLSNVLKRHYTFKD